MLPRYDLKRHKAENLGGPEMGEWSDYFEDFPEENPTNQPDYSLEVVAELSEERKRLEAKNLRLQDAQRRKREQAQAELHRSIGALMEAYSWFDVHLGLKIKTHSNSAPEVIALLNPKSPMKLRLECLKRLVEDSPVYPETTRAARWGIWIAQAEKVRLLRNDYAHGRWVYNHGNTSFFFAPLGWDVGTQSAGTPIAISPAEIDARAAEIWVLIRSMDDMLRPCFPLSRRNLKADVANSESLAKTREGN